MAKSVETSAKSLFKKIGDLQLMGWNSDRHEPNSWSAYGISYDAISGEDHLFVAVRFDGEYKKYFVTHIALWSGAKRGGLTGWEPREMPATLARHSIKTALPMDQLLSGIIKLLERGDAKMKRAANYLQHGRSALREKEESSDEPALKSLMLDSSAFEKRLKEIAKNSSVADLLDIYKSLFNIEPTFLGRNPTKKKVVEAIIRQRRRIRNFDTASTISSRGHKTMSTVTPIKTAPRKKFKATASEAKTFPYYSLIMKSRDDGDWSAQWGDYDRNVVIQEQKDSYPIRRDDEYSDFVIVEFQAPDKRKGAYQKDIEAFVEKLNAGKVDLKKRTKARGMKAEEASFKEEADKKITRDKERLAKHKTRKKATASMYDTKPYYIIFAKTEDGDWEQGFGDYNKNVVIQERKDEITKDRGYKTGPLDWFIADFDAPKRGGASQNVVDAFRNALVQGKFKIKADMLVGKARILNVNTVYRKGGEEASVKNNKKAKSAPALSPWEDNSPLDDVLIKSVASDDNPYKSNPKETAMEFKFELPFSNRMMEKLKMAEEPSFEDAENDPKKRPLIALLKRSKGKDKLIFETVGEASDFLYAIASGLFGDEDWGDYNPAQGKAKEKAFPAMKAAMSKDQIAAVNKLRKNVWSAW